MQLRCETATERVSAANCPTEGAGKLFGGSAGTSTRSLLGVALSLTVY